MAGKILIAWKNSDSETTYGFDRDYTVGDYTVSLRLHPSELQGFLDQTESTIESGDFIFDEGGSFFNYPVLTGKTFSLTGTVYGGECDYAVPFAFWETMLGEVTGDDGLATFDLLMAFGDSWDSYDEKSARTIEARLVSPATTTWTGRSSFDFSLEMKSEDTGWEGTSESISIWDPITVEAGKGISVTASGTTYTVATTGSGEESYGTGSSATGTDSTAIGTSAVAGDGSTALGSGADASAEDSDALGSGASAEVSWAVAVGAGSVATTAETVSFGTGNSVDTATYVYILATDDEGEESYEVIDMESLEDGETYYILESDGSYTACTYEDSGDEDEITYAYVLDDDGNYVLTDMDDLSDGETYYVLESDGTYTERTYEESDGDDDDGSEEETAPATRRLVNVSEGEDGTDAVNVDQLTEVADEVDALGDRVTNVEADLVETQADVQANADAIANISLSVPTVSAGTSNVNVEMTDATDEVALDYAVDVTAVSVAAGDNVTVTSEETTETTVDENGDEVEFTTAVAYTIDGRDTVVAAGDNITVAESTDGNTTTYTITGKAGTSSGSGDLCIGTTNCLTTDDDGCLVTTGSLGNAYITGVVMGTDSAASGDYSSALGYSNTASGSRSSALGYSNTASGTDSSAVGYSNTASRSYSSAVGLYSRAYGYNSLAVGIGRYATSSSAGTAAYNYAYGLNSTAVGICNVAGNSSYTGSTSYAYQTAVGYRNTASGTQSSALGYLNTASGSYSSGVGYSNTASGDGSSAVGCYNTASGDDSSALGVSNTASGTESSALGVSNTASGSWSSALGYYNTITDDSESFYVYKNVFGVNSSISILEGTENSSGYALSVFGANSHIANTDSGNSIYGDLICGHNDYIYDSFYSGIFGRGCTIDGGTCTYAIGQGASNSTSYSIQLGGSSNKYIRYYGTLTSLSDERDKSNIEELGIDATALLNEISAVDFNYDRQKPCTKKQAASELSAAKSASEEAESALDEMREAREKYVSAEEEAQRAEEENPSEGTGEVAAAVEDTESEDGEAAALTAAEAREKANEAAAALAELDEVTEDDVEEARRAAQKARIKMRSKENLVELIDSINSMPDEETKHIGLTAQNVQAALESAGLGADWGTLVSEAPEVVDDYTVEHLTVNYIGFIPILIKAVQELSARIDELEAAQS